MSDNLWVLIQRSPELAGVWRADIPALEYFAQGRTLSAAIEAAREVSEVFLEDRGFVPLRSMARHEELCRALLEGLPIRTDEVDERADRIDALVVQLRMDLTKRTVSLPVSMFGCSS